MSEGGRCRLCGGTQLSVVVTGLRDWEFGVDGTYDYHHCTGCGGVQLCPFPTLNDLKRAYPLHYIGWVESAAAKGRLYKLLFELQERLLRRSLRRMVPPGARVLDIGCGNGELLERLGAMGASRIEGIDFSERAVELAKRRGVAAWLGTFLNYPADDAIYDLVMMNNYLEHTLDPRAELERARRLLKPGGHLVGDLPNFSSLDRILFGRYWGGGHVPRHTFQFEPRQLERLLRQAGFAAARVKQEINPVHFALSIQNLLQRRQPNLAANPNLTHGRAWYLNWLTLSLLPINLIFAALRKSGVMRITARA